MQKEENTDEFVQQILKLFKSKLEHEVNQLGEKPSVEKVPFYKKYKELILLFLGFFLTTLIGTFLGNYFQTRFWEKERKSELEVIEKEAATEIFKEISFLLDKRLYRSNQLLEGLRDNENEKIIQTLSNNYFNVVRDWNESESRILALTQRYFGINAMKKIRSSIIPNFNTLNKLMEDYLKEKTLSDFQDRKMNNLFATIEVDIFQFNLEMITQIQNSKVGLFKEIEETLIINTGKYEYINTNKNYPEIQNPNYLTIEELSEIIDYYELYKISAPNNHLSFSEGDISYWNEQHFSEDEINLELKVRRFIIDKANRENEIIKDQGELSWRSQQIIQDLKGKDKPK